MTQSLSYLVPYVLYSYDLDECRRDVDSRGLLVSFLLANRDSGELRCPATALINYM